MLESTLGRVCAGEDLSLEEMSAAIDAIMQGRCSDGEIATLLTSLRAKGHSVEEVAGAAAAMRRHMVPIRSRRQGLLDNCGTGGDASGTFNISTAAALVTAAAGVPIAKHGNRAMTSKTGSADVLAALGVNIEADVATVERCLDEVGIGFCFAPMFHPAMRHVAAVRKKLGVPTIFNLLGPLCNPASAPYQLLGVGRRDLQQLLAEALVLLGTQRAVLVCGEDGLDEVTLAGTTSVIEATPSGSRTIEWTPEDFGLPRASLDAIQVVDAEESAAVIRDVLSGESGTAREIVVANAAAALWTVGRSEGLRECARLACEAIDSGAASETLARLVAVSQS